MRRRRRRVEEAPNHDRWLLSYSDFMTLLFALFVVLFATSYRDNLAIKKIALAIHSGFQDLGAYSGQAGRSGVADLRGSSNGDHSAASMVDEKSALELASREAGIDLTALRKQLEAALGKEIKNGEVDMLVTPEGFVISLKDIGFFASGEATLRPGAAEKIGRIAKVLAQHKLNLRIEGHSDDQPIHTVQFRSNWDLSTARAMTVLLWLINNSSVDPSRLSVAGYGQYRPIADNSTLEGRQRNRRIDLVVVAATGPQAHKM